MTPTEEHMREAQEILPQIKAGGDTRILEKIIATALATAEARGREQAAKLAEALEPFVASWSELTDEDLLEPYNRMNGTRVVNARAALANYRGAKQ